MEATASVTLMSPDEARQCVDQIKANLENVRALVFELHEREGWKALDYPTWHDCITAEFHMSVRHAHRLLNAHMVDRILAPGYPDGPVGHSGPIPERHARELEPLVDDSEAVREVYAEVQEATNGRATAADYHEAVSHRLAPTHRAPDPAFADDYVEEASQDTHGCDDCGQMFSLAVWHCPTCGSHYADPHDDICKNCLSAGEYTYRPGFIPDPDDEFAGGPRVEAVDALPAEPTLGDLVEGTFTVPPRGLDPHAKAWHAAVAPAMYGRLDPAAVIATREPREIERGLEMMAETLTYVTRLMEAGRLALGRSRLEVVQ